MAMVLLLVDDELIGSVPVGSAVLAV